MAEKKSTDDLAGLAYLYVGGELSAPEAEAFEHLLASDQAAREAVAEAVELHALLRGETVQPDPAYRGPVRQRLRPSWWRRLLARRSYRGHPLAWSLLGAVAALLLSLTVLRPAPEVQVEVKVIEREADPLALDPGDAEDSLHDISFVWAELSTPEHVTRAAAEESKRKTRQEDRRQARLGHHPAHP